MTAFLALLGRPAGKWILGGLAVAAVAFLIYARGLDHNAAQRAALAAANQSLALQLDTTQAVAAADRTLVEQLRQQDLANQELIDAYEAEIAAGGTGACLATDADIGLLRGLR